MARATKSQSQPYPIDRRRSLAGIPVLNPGVAVNDANPKRIKVTVRVKRGGNFFSHFLPPVLERNVKLDELGSFVLSQVDGEKSTRDIIDAFIDHYRVNRREAELSCVEFLKSLAIRRVISIAIK